VSEIDRLIQKGVSAARTDRKEEAEEWLREAVALDPNSERAWLWLSAVVEGTEAQKECLRRVMEINPSNSFARMGLRFISHLRPGYEYMAARAPWVEGIEEGRAALNADASPQRCPRCGTVNPGWAYLCNRCAGPLESVDVAEMAKRELLQNRQGSLVRPWASAAVLDATRAFEPEVLLASPLRGALAVALGTLALSLLRLAGTVGIVTLTTRSQPLGLLNRLMNVFLLEEFGLLLGGLVAWVVLSAATWAIARSLGGVGSPRVHSYLVAVALSAWMPISGVMGLLWWSVAFLIPQAPVPLMAALSSGLLFFYAVTLIVQALHVTHRQQPLRETASVGALLIGGTLLYVLVAAFAPAGLQRPLLKVVEVILLPLSP